MLLQQQKPQADSNMASSESAQDGNNNPVEGGEDTTGFCGAEGYSLAAGLALGMVTLGYGNDNCSDGLADLKIEDKLYNYMVGAFVAGAKAETNGQPGQVRMNSAITSASQGGTYPPFTWPHVSGLGPLFWGPRRRRL